MEETIC